MELALEVKFYLDFHWVIRPTESWPTEVTSNTYLRGVLSSQSTWTTKMTSFPKAAELEFSVMMRQTQAFLPTYGGSTCSSSDQKVRYVFTLHTTLHGALAVLYCTQQKILRLEYVHFWLVPLFTWLLIAYSYLVCLGHRVQLVWFRSEGQHRITQQFG